MPALLRLLAQGGHFSAGDLACQLGVHEREVRQLLAELRTAGLGMDVRGQADTVLTGQMELLDVTKIQSELSDRTHSLLERLEVHACTDSTNSYLLAQPPPGMGRGRACLAEWQRRGRGRRGRQWTAPPGGSLCLSVSWFFPPDAGDISALGLACGVAIAQGLTRIGVPDLGLKWPNDLIWNDSKLAGILAESSRQADGSVYVVIGVGLNVDLGAASERIEPGWSATPTDLRQCVTGELPGRNRLAAILLEALLGALWEFQQLGFAAFQGAWTRLDQLAGRQVTVHSGESAVVGIVEGIDSLGALLLRVNGRQMRFLSGETTLRPGNAAAD